MVLIQDILSDLHNTSDLVILEAVAMASAYKEKALHVKCSTSAKQWRLFCVSQLNGNVGAGVLHRFVNRQNAAPAVPLFKPGPTGEIPKTLNAAVEQDCFGHLACACFCSACAGLPPKRV